jgi:glycosyltransferase involved in cell wall biosynthesis
MGRHIQPEPVGFSRLASVSPGPESTAEPAKRSFQKPAGSGPAIPGTAGPRITFVIASLTSGGAERVMTTMANYWTASGRPVTLLTMTGTDQPPFYPLSPAVDLRPLGLASPSGSPAHALLNNVRRLRELRRAVAATRPDLVISFLDNTNVVTLLATRGLGVPVVVAEHTDPGLKRMHPVWRTLRRMTYPRASQVVVLTGSSKRFFPALIQAKTRIVPNPIQVDPGQPPAERGRRRMLVSMGRFGPEKGFDLLIDAFARIAADLPEWDLVIWGEGTLRPELEAQRARLGLAGRVQLPGRTSTPHNELRAADLYALSSRREGFPMALAEALACGLPAVAFDLPSGPRDIMRDGIDGVLVPNGDVPALADALASLMRDGERRAAMAAAAPEVLDRFGVERVMAIWDDLVRDVTRS